jgi:hypothetical protein
MSMMTANTKSKFEGLNVNFPSKIYPLDADKYDAMKEAMLDILPKTGPGMTVPEIKERVGPILDGPCSRAARRSDGGSRLCNSISRLAAL